MRDKKSRKDIKKMKNELNRLKELLKKLELRPCRGDADLKQKDEEVQMLKRTIYDLERETNIFVIFTEHGESIKI
ncbi:hypothetical protein ACFLZG_07675 [Thermodesulfobacteriota bacterium]